MDNSETQIERDIQAKGLTAPRLTPDMIDAAIEGEVYHNFPGTTLTICVLTLFNGFTVTGESAAASPQNFDQAIGRRIARENARQKIWALEGYRLKTLLHNAQMFGAETDHPPPLSDLAELKIALIELASVACVVATDVPLQEEERARFCSALAEARRLTGGN